LLDAAEPVLDDVAATGENLGPRSEAFGHAIERVLDFETGHRANVVRASRAERTNAAGFRVAVVDLLEIAQPAVAGWRQQLPGRADVGVAPSVVSELVPAEEALAHRRSSLRLGDMRNAARLLAGLDVLHFEVAAVGDDVDRFDPENVAGRLDGC
jgi:hypothetical protein